MVLARQCAEVSASTATSWTTTCKRGTCMTKWPTATQHIVEDLVHSLTDQQAHSEPKYATNHLFQRLVTTSSVFLFDIFHVETPADFTAAVAAALLTLALDQESPASSDHSASSGSVVALCFVPGGRASPADLTAAVATALFMSYALGHKGPPASPEVPSVVVLCFAFPGGSRDSPTVFATVVTPALVVRADFTTRPSEVNVKRFKHHRVWCR